MAKNAEDTQQDCFQSQATVFILENRDWKERGNGLVRFVFDLKTYQLMLTTNPNTPNEFSCRLKPRIRSKGPRAYVIRAESTEDSSGSDNKIILAVRFEREADSQSFRGFVERRDVPQKKNSRRKHTSSRQVPNTSQYTNPPTTAPLGMSSRGGTTNAVVSSGGVLDSYGGGRYHSSSNAVAQHTHPSGGRVTASHQPSHTVPYGLESQLRRPIAQPPNAHHMIPSTLAPTGGNTHTMPVRDYEESFFWTCPSCLQMNDAHQSQCAVCNHPKHGVSNSTSMIPVPSRMQQQQQKTGGGGAQRQRTSTSVAVPRPPPQTSSPSHPPHHSSSYPPPYSRPHPHSYAPQQQQQPTTLTKMNNGGNPSGKGQQHQSSTPQHLASAHHHLPTTDTNHHMRPQSLPHIPIAALTPNALQASVPEVTSFRPFSGTVPITDTIQQQLLNQSNANIQNRASDMNRSSVPGPTYDLGVNAYHRRPDEEAILVPLTVENLNRHNRLYPNKRRSVKDILIDQIKWKYGPSGLTY